MALRPGVFTRAYLVPESVWNTDPGSPTKILLDLGQQEGFNHTRARVPAEVYGRGRAPFGSILGMQAAEGEMLVRLEHTTIGHIIKLVKGSAAASVATGGGFLHYFGVLPTDVPLSYQLQKEWFDQTVKYARNKGIYQRNLRMGFDTQGVASYTLDAVGSGEQVLTDVGGSVVDNGYVARSYFNGVMLMDDVKQGGIVNYQLNFNLNPQRVDAAFKDGIAAGIVPGIFQPGGTLALLLEDDFAPFWVKAINDGNFKLDMMWTHGSVATATQFLRIVLGLNKFSEGANSVGGQEARRVSQDFQTEWTDSATGACGMPGELFSAVEPFTITGPAVDLGIKVNGAATITKTITAGVRTAAQCDTDIGAVTGGSADVWPMNTQGVGGRLRIATNTIGVGGSIAIDTTIPNSCHAAFGFDSTVRTGKAPAIAHFYLFNAQSATY